MRVDINTNDKLKNKIQQGRENRIRILEVVNMYPVMTPSLAAYITGIRLGTVQVQLMKLSARGEIAEQKRGLGEEYLYRKLGKGKLKQIDHMLGISEAWAALQRGATVGILVHDELPQEFVSTAGTVIPDLVFSVTAHGKKRFFTWEEDKGSMRKKDECLAKYVGMWQWRKDYCYDTKGQNRWGIQNITVLTSAESDRRMHELQETANKAHPEGKLSRMFLFTSRERWSLTEPSKLLAEPIWLTAWDETPRKLLSYHLETP